MRSTSIELRDTSGKRCGALLFTLCALPLLLCGCAVGGSDKATPEQAKRFLKLDGYDFDEKAFLAAAAAGDVMAVRSFLEAGINPNARDQSAETALIAAASRGDMDVVKTLLQGGADPNPNVRGGYTALLLALTNRHDEVADVLAAQPSLDLNARGSGRRDRLNDLRLATP